MKKDFMIGYNYWSSDAGLYMWQNFNPDCIEKDMALLEEYGTNTIRAFPIWSEFQPIKYYYDYLNVPREIRYTDDRLLDDSPEGICGIDIGAIEKMQWFLDCAQRHNIKVILSLVTGWMSGRMFVPPALEGKNVMCDSTALKWEIRYIRYLVNRFCEHPAIIAWGLGNECNCISSCPPDQTYVWVHLVASTIRQFDKNKLPIYNDLALEAPYVNGWSIPEEAELVDVLVTHPYNVFQPNCLYDSTVSFRSLMHMSMETALNQTIGNKPAFAEEIGTIGPMMGGGDTQARFMNVALYESLARGFIGLMPWCAFDQQIFDYPPYDWSMLERELGGFSPDYEPHPHATVLKEFRQLLDKYDLGVLDAPKPDAVCILTHCQNTWQAAYGAYALARQADVNLKFTLSEQSLPESDLYIMPSFAGNNYAHYQYIRELLRRVENGATLYMSMGAKNFMPEFEKNTGIRITASLDRSRNAIIDFKGNSMNICSNWTYIAKSLDATILASDQDGNPVLVEKAYGKGRIITLLLPLETYLATTPDVMSSMDADRYVELYKYLAAGKQSLVSKTRKNERYLLKTEQPLEDGRTLLILANPNEEFITDTIDLNGFKFSEASDDSMVEDCGGSIKISLASGQGVLVFLKEN